MKTTFLRWGRGFKRVATEEVILNHLDGFNKTRYSRRKNKEGLLEKASKEAHENKKVYFATIYDDNTPTCFIESNDGYFYVGFLDEKLRVYMSYKFDEEFQAGKLFLKEVMYFYFEDNEEDSNRANKFQFSPNGNFRLIELNYRNNYQDILTAQEPLSQEVISHLWEDYPEFGKYDNLIKLERLPKDLLEKM